MKINTTEQYNKTKHKFLTGEDENFRFYGGMEFTNEYLDEMINQTITISDRDFRPENFSNTREKVLNKICELTKIEKEDFPFSFSLHLKKELKTWKNCFKGFNKTISSSKKSKKEMKVNVLNIFDRYREHLLTSGEIVFL